MREIPAAQSSALLPRYLAAAYVLLIVYASLSPFTGWRNQGLEVSAVLAAPLSQTYSQFDAIVNVLAYVPLGLLLSLSFRARCNARWSALLAMLGGTTLSAVMEYAQMYLPSRTSSNLDLLTNTGGTLLGVLLAIKIAPSGWLGLLARWRHTLARRGGSVDFGLALIALWMFAQINPLLPMLGNIFISEAARHPFPAMPPEPFSWLESIAVALNLLMMGCLLITLLEQRRHAVIGLILALCAVALLKFLAAALLLKSWALLLWLNGEAMLGIFAGLLLLIATARLPDSWISPCAALSAMAYLGLVEGMLDSGSPFVTIRLYHWHEGHLLTYNGLSHVILLLYPALVLVYLWRIRGMKGVAV